MSLKVLIAEDQLLIADLLEETLISHGYEVVGIARTVDEAVALGELHKPDLAILDVRLARGGHGPDIAHRLHSTGKIGVLYATGDDVRNSSLTKDDGNASLAKPYQQDDVARALMLVRQIMAKGNIVPPYPSGFRVLADKPANGMIGEPV